MKKKKKVKQSVKGVLHGVPVLVSLCRGQDSYVVWDNKTIAKMLIGRDHAWRRVLAGLLHEAFEYDAVLLRLRFEPADICARRLSNVIFFWTHEQYGEICDDVGSFLAQVLPSVREMYDAQKK